MEGVTVVGTLDINLVSFVHINRGSLERDELYPGKTLLKCNDVNQKPCICSILNILLLSQLPQNVPG